MPYQCIQSSQQAATASPPVGFRGVPVLQEGVRGSRELDGQRGVKQQGHGESGTRGREGTVNVISESPCRNVSLLDAGLQLLESSEGMLYQGVSLEMKARLLLWTVARCVRQVCPSPFLPGDITRGGDKVAEEFGIIG